MNLKSRKLIGGIVLIILATILALTEAMTASLFDKWSMFVFLVYTSYVVGNVGSKAAITRYKEVNNGSNS